MKPLKEDSEEYLLWRKIVNDVYLNCGDDADAVIERIEKFVDLVSSQLEPQVRDQIVDIGEYDKIKIEQVKHLNSLENTWD